MVKCLLPGMHLSSRMLLELGDATWSWVPGLGQWKIRFPSFISTSRSLHSPAFLSLLNVLKSLPSCSFKTSSVMNKLPGTSSTVSLVPFPVLICTLPHLDDSFKLILLYITFLPILKYTKVHDLHENKNSLENKCRVLTWFPSGKMELQSRKIL